MTAAEPVLAEALARVEHKLDLILGILKNIGTFSLTPMGDPKHVCPVCTTAVSYIVNILQGVVSRTCLCGTGKQSPLDLSMFNPASPLKELSPKETPNVIDENGSDPGRRRNSSTWGGSRNR